MAVISHDSSTKTSITVYLSSLDTSYSGSRIIIWFLDGDRDGISSLSPGVSKSDTYTFSGLLPGTKYTIGAEVRKIPSQDLLATLKDRILSTESDEEPEPPGEEIQRWSWENSPFYAGEEIKANIAASEWDDLVDKINECLRADGQSWDSRYLSRASSKMSADKILYANKFNSVVYNLKNLVGSISSIPVVTSKTSKVLASYFNDIEDELDQWIVDYNRGV